MNRLVRTTALVLAVVFGAVAMPVPSSHAQVPTRISELTRHPGAIPRRLVGYGLVTGLDGSGDRSFGVAGAGAPSVRSVVNLLRRFQVEVPEEYLRLRNVAAVLVTAEISPWLRAGGRFEVHVSALGDATSLRGGVLWMTPLVEDADTEPVATAQGTLFLPEDGPRGISRRGNSGRIPQGGVLELDPGQAPVLPRELLLRDPDLGTATRIAEAVNAAFGAGSARVLDPGAVGLSPKGGDEAALGFLAAVDTLLVTPVLAARIVIDGREGTVVSGGDLAVGSAMIHHQGVTLQVGGPPREATGGLATGWVRLDSRASVQDIAAGLHAAGVRPQDVAAIFESLRAAGALRAEVVVR